jgi:periplasmic protein TonB
VRDVYEILREKENAVERVRREVEALRSVVPWLADEAAIRSKVPVHPSVPMEAATEMVSRQREALRKASPFVADETYDLADKIRALRISPAQPITKSEPSMISPTVIENSAGQTIPINSTFISSVSHGQGAGAAAAPAKEVSAAKTAGSETSSAFAGSSAWVPSFSGLDEHGLEQTWGTKNGFAIAILTILVIALAAYFGSSRHEKKTLETPAANAAQVQAVPSAALVRSAQQQPTTPAAPQSHVTRQSIIFAPPAPSKPSPSTKSAAPESTEEDTIVALPQVAPMKVKSDLSRHTEAKAAPKDQRSLPAPLNITGPANAGDKAVSDLVAGTPMTPPKPTPEVLNISQGVTQGLLIKRVQPVYPPQALAKRIQGLVQLQATISKDGSITNLKLISGQDVLGQAAMEAVRQWKYQPYYLNGRPAEIQTQITVNFSTE